MSRENIRPGRIPCAHLRHERAGARADAGCKSSGRSPERLRMYQTQKRSTGYSTMSDRNLVGSMYSSTTPASQAPSARWKTFHRKRGAERLRSIWMVSFLCARNAVPLLKSAGGGCIINMSSTAGLGGCPNRAPYVGVEMGGHRADQDARDGAGHFWHPCERDMPGICGGRADPPSNRKPTPKHSEKAWKKCTRITLQETPCEP